jgi:hypothetical protein
MSQSTLSIPNEAGASFRADNNTAHQAQASQQSGASAPATTYAYQRWADTTNGVVKRRNAANSAWVNDGPLAETYVVARSSNTILGVADYGKTFIASSTFTQTLTAAATLGDGWFAEYHATGVITLDPNSSETINGATTLVLFPGDSCIIVCDGSNFRTIGLPSRDLQQTSQSANYTTVAADAYGQVLHPVADNNPRTFTIDSNANVPYKVGATLTFANEINTLTIAITSDTLLLGGTASTGSRTLAAGGIATAVKITSTKWIITGAGLS